MSWPYAVLCAPIAYGLLPIASLDRVTVYKVGWLLYNPPLLDRWRDAGDVEWE